MKVNREGWIGVGKVGSWKDSSGSSLTSSITVICFVREELKGSVKPNVNAFPATIDINFSFSGNCISCGSFDTS